MDSHTLFGKLKENKMELERLVIGEEGEKKRKSLTLKVEDSISGGDMTLIVNKFKRFLSHEKQQKEKQEKYKEKASFTPTRYLCRKKGISY